MSSSLEIKAIPTPKGSDHKPVKHPELPQHEFTLGIIAPKGSGKTTTIINLLRMYKEKHNTNHRVISIKFL